MSFLFVLTYKHVSHGTTSVHLVAQSHHYFMNLTRYTILEEVTTRTA